MFLFSRSSTWIVVCAAGLALNACTASAQEEVAGPINTERPTAGPSPDTIPAGSLQFENGANVSFQRHQYAADLPENFVRYGLTERLEVRMQTTNTIFQPSHDPAVKSLQTGDMAVSTKFLVAKPNSLVPRSAILGLSAPTGSASLSSGSYDPSLALIWTQAMHRGYFVNEVVAGTLTTLFGARRPAWAPSIAAGRAFTETVTGFAEYAPSLLQDHSLSTIVDGGFAFTRGRLRQLDVRAGYLQDAAGIHTLISFGYSLRQDHFLHGILHHHAEAELR